MDQLEAAEGHREREMGCQKAPKADPGATAARVRMLLAVALFLSPATVAPTPAPRPVPSRPGQGVDPLSKQAAPRAAMPNPKWPSPSHWLSSSCGDAGRGDAAGGEQGQQTVLGRSQKAVSGAPHRLQPTASEGSFRRSVSLSLSRGTPSGRRGARETATTPCSERGGCRSLRLRPGRPTP